MRANQKQTLEASIPDNVESDLQGNWMVVSRKKRSNNQGNQEGNGIFGYSRFSGATNHRGVGDLTKGKNIPQVFRCNQ